MPKYENPNIQERSQASLGLVSEVIDGLNMRGAQLEPYPSPCSDVSVTFKPGIQTRLLPNSWQFNIISSSSSLPTISYAKNRVNKFWWGLDVLNLRTRVFSLIKKQDARRKKVMSLQLVFMFGARLSINAAPERKHWASLITKHCTITVFPTSSAPFASKITFWKQIWPKLGHRTLNPSGIVPNNHATSE